MYGREHPVQRCQAHKLRNVLGYLPKHLQQRAAAALRAWWKLEPKERMARLRKQAEWLERAHLVIHAGRAPARPAANHKERPWLRS
ncbi:MAG TPA: hypothetical protein VM221_09880 [Armatimonadota bacterium]|nr:hypothetical protein [Armatimonadota bacterium]